MADDRYLEDIWKDSEDNFNSLKFFQIKAKTKNEIFQLQANCLWAALEHLGVPATAIMTFSQDAENAGNMFNDALQSEGVTVERREGYEDPERIGLYLSKGGELVHFIGRVKMENKRRWTLISTIKPKKK